MMKLEYSAPVIRCRQIHTANCFMLRASMGEDSPPIEQSSSAPTDLSDPVSGDGVDHVHYDAWGDAKKNNSFDWD